MVRGGVSYVENSAYWHGPVRDLKQLRHCSGTQIPGIDETVTRTATNEHHHPRSPLFLPGQEAHLPPLRCSVDDVSADACNDDFASERNRGAK